MRVIQSEFSTFYTSDRKYTNIGVARMYTFPRQQWPLRSGLRRISNQARKSQSAVISVLSQSYSPRSNRQEPDSSIELTYPERQEKLSSIWGFDCTCALCTASESIRNASDARRLKFRSLRNDVLQLAQDGEFDKAVAATKEMFAVVDEENLNVHIGDLYEIPARLHYQIGDLENAHRYFKRSMAELDSWGVPGPEEEASLENAKGIMARLEEEMEEQKRQKRRKQQVYLGKQA